MTKTIKIARDVIKERSHIEANTYRRVITKYTETEEYTARVISERLAIYRYEKGHGGISPSESHWYVIHIPTGYVIADIPYNLVSTVKKTFEESDWTLKTDDNGARYLSIVDEPFTWEIYPRIQYTIIKEIQK